MGHDKPKQTKELQDKNLAAFDAWIKSHGKMVMPIPNHAVIYAGFPPADLMKVKKLMTSEQQLRGMWKIIEDADKEIREISGQTTYHKLNDVLKRLKGPLPVLVATDGADIGHTKKFSDMLSCAEHMTDKNWSLIDKGKFNHVWDALSEQYVKNSRGDVQIWEGRKANHQQINISTTLIRKELAALVARNDLPPATLKAASELVVRYVSHHKKQEIYSDKVVDTALKVLRDAKKR